MCIAVLVSYDSYVAWINRFRTRNLSRLVFPFVMILLWKLNDWGIGGVQKGKPIREGCVKHWNWCLMTSLVIHEIGVKCWEFIRTWRLLNRPTPWAIAIQSQRLTIRCIDGGITKSLRKILHRINYCFNNIFSSCAECLWDDVMHDDQREWAMLRILPPGDLSGKHRNNLHDISCVVFHGDHFQCSNPVHHGVNFPQNFVKYMQIASTVHTPSQYGSRPLLFHLDNSNHATEATDMSLHVSVELIQLLSAVYS